MLYNLVQNLEESYACGATNLLRLFGLHSHASSSNLGCTLGCGQVEQTRRGPRAIPTANACVRSPLAHFKFSSTESSISETSPHPPQKQSAFSWLRSKLRYPGSNPMLGHRTVGRCEGPLLPAAASSRAQDPSSLIVRMRDGQCKIEKEGSFLVGVDKPQRICEH